MIRGMFFLPWYPDILPHARLTPACWLTLTAAGRVLRFKGDLPGGSKVLTASHAVPGHGDTTQSVGAGPMFDAGEMFEARTVAKGKASGRVGACALPRPAFIPAHTRFP